MIEMAVAEKPAMSRLT